VVATLPTALSLRRSSPLDSRRTSSPRAEGYSAPWRGFSLRSTRRHPRQGVPLCPTPRRPSKASPSWRGRGSEGSATFGGDGYFCFDETLRGSLLHVRSLRRGLPLCAHLPGPALGVC